MSNVRFVVYIQIHTTKHIKAHTNRIYVLENTYFATLINYFVSSDPRCLVGVNCSFSSYK